MRRNHEEDVILQDSKHLGADGSLFGANFFSYWISKSEVNLVSLPVLLFVSVFP